MAAYVRFIAAALEDLEALFKKDPQIVRHALKKCLVLERDPFAGEPLLGDLIGYRKLVVGDRDWRIVWRVVDIETEEVEIAEVWAVGARRDSEVYDEIRQRIEDLPDTPLTRSLSDIVSRFAPKAGIQATPEPVSDPVPAWLRDRLLYTAGLREDQIEGLSGSMAADLWDRYMREGSFDDLEP